MGKGTAIFGGLSCIRRLSVQLKAIIVFMPLALSGPFLFTVWKLEHRNYHTQTNEHARALVQSVAVFCQGDAHAGQGIGSDLALDDVTEYLGQLHTLNPRLITLRTLEFAPEAALQIRADPSHVHTGALTIGVGLGGEPSVVDFWPYMAPALLDGEATTAVLETTFPEPRLVAYAPILDSWGRVQAVVEAHFPAYPAHWRPLVNVALHGLVAVALASALIKLFFYLLDRAMTALDRATLRVQGLALGRLDGRVSTSPASLEIAELEKALDNLERFLATHVGADPSDSAVPLVADHQEPPRAPVHEPPVTFEIAPFVQQIVDGARNRALQCKIDLQVSFGDAVPERVIGYPEGIYRALSALLKNAFAYTPSGTINVRIFLHAVGEDFVKLRFEVADSGQGIAWKDQPALGESLRQAAESNPQDLRDPRLRAAALARQLGGEYGFESQPGFGSRFWFTACFGQAEVDRGTKLQLSGG